MHGRYRLTTPTLSALRTPSSSTTTTVIRRNCILLASFASPRQPCVPARAVRSTARSHHPPPRGPPPLRHLFLQRQVVAGTLTRVELEWAPSSCLKPLAGCAGVGAAVGTLKGKVWSQPWRDFLEVTLDE
jgi:hypothetical protein